MSENHYLTLNEQQTAAVKSIDGAVLLLAVPGSGKTTVLTARLGYMINTLHISPDSILVLTFTVAAANEMKQRFIRLFSNGSEPPEFRTINGVAQKIVNEYSYRMNRDPFELITDERRQSEIISSVYREATGMYANENIISEIRTRITRTKNGMLSREEIKSLETIGLPFNEIYEKYRSFLRENRLMDFDDQLVFAYTILNKYPSIRNFYTQKYKYICVDEAQDTSKIQHRIIELLTGKNGNIFMVGDEDQSIYGFRGAYPDYLLNFEHSYPQALILKSEENFRSTPEITGLADAFVQKNAIRIQKTIRPARTEHGMVEDIAVKDIPEQYEKLLELLKKRENETKTVAVLYRNNESALPLIDKMLRKRIDFSCRDSDCTFFTNRGVLDVLSILRLADNGSDYEAFFNIYYKLGLFLTREAARTAVDEAKRTGETVLETLLRRQMLSKTTSEKCRRVIGFLSYLKRLKVADAVNNVDRMPCFKQDDEIIEPGKKELLSLLAVGQPSVRSFLDHLEELRKTVKQGVRGSGNLTLSTVHSAKGLEFDSVYLISVVDGVLPSVLLNGGRVVDADDREIYEEDRRLFYVAVTRAKNYLGVFSFRSPDCRSSFSDEFFGKDKKEEKARASKKKNRDGSKERFFPFFKRQENASGSDSSFDMSEVKIGVGTEIKHSSFGVGKVTAKNGDIITAEFVNGRICRLSLSHTLKKGIVKTQ